MAEVRLDHVHKTYKGGVEAVKDLNLTVHDGEFLALLGPSGCGKTSTLRMIVGLEEITKGEIYIGDRPMSKLEPSQRNVALAFETYALYPPLPVYENIAFCLRAKKTDPAEVDRRVRQVAQMLDIEDILNRKPSELGGGQKQRVALARALVREPSVFLLDEPLSHLDAAQRAHMRVEFKRLHAAIDRTMILVTHDQLEAIAMAERIAVMNLGVLQQVGTFDEVYNHPVNEFVAGFIGEPPMNFLDCAPVERDSTMHLVAEDNSFDVPLPDMWRERINSARPEKLTLGVRPVDMQLATGTPKSGTPGNAAPENGTQKSAAINVNARVITFESLGEEGQLAARLGNKDVLVVTPYDVQLAHDDAITLQIKTDHIHLFDAATTQAI